MRTHKTSIEVEISTDGVTVWVNTWRCLARFSPYAREYFETVVGDGQTMAHKEPTIAEWKLFVNRVRDLWSIDVPSDFMPSYIVRSGL